MQIVRHNPTEPPPIDATVVEGTVRLRELAGKSLTGQLRVLTVRFDPGARNLMHSHSVDQVLYILEGDGIVATETEEHRVSPGDTVVVPAGEQHWHGATPKSAMTHLAISIPGTMEVGGRPFNPTE